MYHQHDAVTMDSNGGASPGLLLAQFMHNMYHQHDAVITDSNGGASPGLLLAQFIKWKQLLCEMKGYQNNKIIGCQAHPILGLLKTMQVVQ